MMTEFPSFPTQHWSQQISQKTAIIWEKGNSVLFSSLPSHITWQTVHQLVEQTAQSLLDETNSPQPQTFAYIGSHRLGGLLCYLAVIALGGRMLMLNPALTPQQQKKILADKRVDKLIGDDHFADFLPFSTACPFPKMALHQPATLTLTSGSSGEPKAVVHSIFNHLSSAAGVCELMQFTQEQSWLLSLPLYHVSGQGIVWRWLLKGATLRINEDKADFYTALAVSTHASLVPTQLQRYLAQKDLPSKQRILLGGAYIPPHLILQAQQQNIDTYAGYGMTEMASTICAVKGEQDNVGKPLFGREVKIEQNEIWVKGDSLALGYWQDGSLQPLSLNNGWFATKDKGEWTEQGRLRVLGRLDNLFISGGENIQPEQIEQILLASNLLKNAIVVPLADPEFGHRPVAFVAFYDGYNLQAVENLQNFTQSRLEKFKQPVAYFPLEEQWQQGGIKVSRKALQQHLETTLSEQHND